MSLYKLNNQILGISTFKAKELYNTDNMLIVAYEDFSFCLT